MFDKIIHVAMFIIICGLIWELIDRILNLRKHNVEQWSKEEREMLDKQGSPPLKINRISNGNTIREAIDSIIFSIFMEFYQNLEFVEWSKKFKKEKPYCVVSHPEGFYRTKVEYNGKKMWGAFYDIRQLGEALYKLASYFYKREEVLNIERKI